MIGIKNERGRYIIIYQELTSHFDSLFLEFKSIQTAALLQKGLMKERRYSNYVKK